MKRWVMLLLCVFLLMGSASAAELPEELRSALPEEAEDLLEGIDPSDAGGWSEGLERILSYLMDGFGGVLRRQMRGAAAVLLAVILCAVVENLYQGAGGKTPLFLTMAGALSVAALTVGDLDSLMGLGRETIGQLSLFGKVLLPTLAAATAVSGAVTTAAFQQVTTVFLVNLLLQLIEEILMPMLYLYVGVLTASCCTGESRLGAVAEGLKKLLSWLLSTALLLFTVYLSVARVVSGAVDGAAVKVAKTAISGVVPVVGGIIADAAETVLAGAGLLKSSIGIFGMLGILAACAYPFLQLGVQYLLYKLAAFLSSAVGAPSLCKLIDGFGGAFGLVLGMTGACALLLLVSVLASVAVVVP